MTGSTLSPVADSAPANAPASASVSLPAVIPDPWLTQIRDAVKPDRSSMALTWLGSSVLAAVIAAASAVSTAMMTIRAAGRLEIEKARIARLQVEEDAARASYEKLEANLGTLLRQFQGAANLIDIARDTNALGIPSDAENVRKQLNVIGQTEGAILELKTDARLDSRVWSQVDGLLNRITAASVDTDPAFRGFSQAAGPIEADLAKAIDSVESARTRVGTSR